MGWKLFLDDFRVPRLVHVDPKEVVVCRTAREALTEIESRGFPEMMYLDFDLGFADDGLSGLDFLKRLRACWSPATQIPAYEIISDHPDRYQMALFMEQWETIARLRIFDAFSAIVSAFPPALTELHRTAWARYSMFCEPNPVWFVLCDPEGVEYDWLGRGGEYVAVRWVPGKQPEVRVHHEQSTPIGVDIASRAHELETHLRSQLDEVDPADAKRLVLTLDLLITDVFERRAVSHAIDCPG